MPVRKVGEPLAIPRAIEVDQIPVETQEEPTYLTLTDSTEQNRVRTPTKVNTPAVIICAVTSAPLSDKEGKTLRNEHTVPEDAAVAPESVVCVITMPNGEVFEPNVQRLAKGLYSVDLPLTAKGNWWYEFTANGGYFGSAKRAIEVR